MPAPADRAPGNLPHDRAGRGRNGLSIAPNIRAQLLEPGVPRECRIHRSIAADLIHQRLRTIPEFVKAHEPDGMAADDTQRTVTQFVDADWGLLEGARWGDICRLDDGLALPDALGHHLPPRTLMTLFRITFSRSQAARAPSHPADHA